MDGFAALCGPCAAGAKQRAAEPNSAWLRQWQRDNRFTDARAAAALGLSERSYRRQKTGRSRVTRQTYLLAQYASIHEPIWLDIAEIAYKLARVTGGGRPPFRSDFTTQAKPPATGSNSSHTLTSQPRDRQYPEILRPNAAAAAFSFK
jgi:hypothetical protein